MLCALSLQFIQLVLCNLRLYFNVMILIIYK